MSAARRSLQLVVALAAACVREDLDPVVTDAPDPLDPLPSCGDGLANDDEICLRSSSVELPYAYSFIRLADFDGDGTPDFLAMNWWLRVSWTLFFTGGVDTGEIKHLISFEFPNHDIYRPAVLDFDGDGRSDLVAASQFSFPAGDIITTELRLVAWRSSGQQEFEEAAYRQAEINPTFASGDIDGDGRTDIFGITSLNTGVAWAYSETMNKVRTVSTIDLSSLELEGEPVLAAADYNQDPHADFVLVDGSGRAWQIFGGPEHQLTLLDVEAPVVLAPGAESLYAQDIDGDGIVDLASAFYTNVNNKLRHTISLALGRPDGGYANLASFDTTYGITMAGNEFIGSLAKVSHLGFIDLDGSGMLALVYAHAQRPELVVHRHIAETRGDIPTIIPLDFPANSLFVDDLAGTGETDIYVTISDIVEIEPTKEVPDGLLRTHYLVRLAPDP